MRNITVRKGDGFENVPIDSSQNRVDVEVQNKQMDQQKFGPWMLVQAHNKKKKY